MDDQLLQFFQRQVLLQCRFLAKAFDDLQKELEALHTPHDHPWYRTESVFYSVHAQLNASANIAKAFWGSGGRSSENREPLRRSVDVADDSPFRLVTMRNHYEHFDERLEGWFDSGVRSFIDCNIMASGDFQQLQVLGQKAFLRNLDPDTYLLTFWGQEFDLLSIYKEACRIIPILEKATDPLLTLKLQHPDLAKYMDSEFGSGSGPTSNPQPNPDSHSDD